MLSFVALPAHETMAIGNASINFDFRSLLAANIEILAWTGEAGHIERNDRPRIVEKIIDPAPYYGLVNAWLGAAAELPQPVTLDQARQVKTDFIASLYFGRRRLPYSYLGHQWAALDEDIAASAIKMLPQVFGSGSAGSLTYEINVRIGQLNYYLNRRPESNSFRLVLAGNSQTSLSPGVAGGFSYGSTGLANSNALVNANFYYLQSYAPGMGLLTIPLDSIAQPAAVAVASIGVTDAAGAVIPWEAVDANQIIRLTVSQAAALMQAISNRNEQLAIIRLRKIGEVRALTTLAGIIAYDAMAGWP